MTFDLSTMSVRKKDQTPGSGYVLAAILAVFCARFLFVSVTNWEAGQRIAAETQAAQAALPQIERLKAQIQVCVANESCVKPSLGANSGRVIDLGWTGDASQSPRAIECLRVACHAGPNGSIAVKVDALGVIEADTTQGAAPHALIERPAVPQNGVVEWTVSAR